MATSIVSPKQNYLAYLDYETDTRMLGLQNGKESLSQSLQLLEQFAYGMVKVINEREDGIAVLQGLNDRKDRIRQFATSLDQTKPLELPIVIVST